MDEIEMVVTHSERTTLKVGTTFLKVDSDQGRLDREVQAMCLVPLPTAEILWRKTPVLALAELSGSPLGRLGDPSSRTSAAWLATGAAIRKLHDAPLPPWVGPGPGEIATELDRKCDWLIANDVLPAEVLAKLPESFAVIGDVQYLPGYCVLLVDDPAVDRLTDLPRSRRLRFLESMDHLGEAIQRACSELDPHFRRLNYEILGNTDAYLHAHIFARYEWEPADRIGGPVWRYDTASFYGDDAALGPQHDELRRRITEYL